MTSRLSMPPNTSALQVQGTSNHPSAHIPEPLHLHAGKLASVAIDQAELYKLARFVAEQLTTTIPYCEAEGVRDEHPHKAIKEYGKAMDKLRTCQRQLRLLCDLILDVQIRPRRSATGNATKDMWSPIEATKDRLKGRLKMKWVNCGSMLTAELVAQPDLDEQLRAHAADCAGRIAYQFVLALNDGVAQGGVGVIEWVTSNSCRYAYPIAPIIPIHESRGYREEFNHRFGIAQTDLIDVTSSIGPPSLLVAPWFVRELIAGIPQFLSPLVRFVDGKVLAHRSIEWDAFQSPGRPIRRREAADDLLAQDPAICIGPFVIAGWTPQDCEYSPGCLYSIVQILECVFASTINR